MIVRQVSLAEGEIVASDARLAKGRLAQRGGGVKRCHDAGDLTVADQPLDLGRAGRTLGSARRVRVALGHEAEGHSRHELAAVRLLNGQLRAVLGGLAHGGRATAQRQDNPDLHCSWAAASAPAATTADPTHATTNAIAARVTIRWRQRCGRRVRPVDIGRSFLTGWVGQAPGMICLKPRTSHREDDQSLR